MALSQILSLTGSRRYLRPLAFLARSLKADADVTLPPVASITTDKARSLFKTAQTMGRGFNAMENAHLLQQVSDTGYAWTPVGRAFALAVRAMPTFDAQFSVKLEDVLLNLPQEHITFLCNMPTEETVPEGLAILADFDLILQRTQTKRWGFRRMSSGDLIEFLDRHPQKAPHPSAIKPTTSNRVDDIAAHQRMLQAVTYNYTRAYGAPITATGIDPAEFDWETDIWEFML